MLKPRYYYSEALMEGNANVVLDATGLIIDFYNIRKPVPKPRITICGIWDTEKNTMSYGAAICSPEDQFVKKTGRMLAYERALSNPIRVIDIPRGRVSETFMTHAVDLETKIEEAKLKVN